MLEPQGNGLQYLQIGPDYTELPTWKNGQGLAALSLVDRGPACHRVQSAHYVDRPFADQLEGLIG